MQQGVGCIAASAFSVVQLAAAEIAADMSTAGLLCDTPMLPQYCFANAPAPSVWQHADHSTPEQ